MHRKWIGEGCYARVFDNLDGTVTKECRDAEGDAWLVWASYCLEHQGEPHIPEIYSVDINWEENTYIARMKLYREPKTRREDLEDWAYDSIEALLPELRARSGRALHNDMSRDNYLLDDRGQVIFTDPIST